MKIALTDIVAAAADRPAGYKEAVLSAGEIRGDMLVIRSAEYVKIFARYRGADVPPFEKNVAGAVGRYRAKCPTCK